MKPVIAITAKTEELRNREQTTIPLAYAKAVEEAGGLPFIIPIVNMRENVASVARLADGFIFSGGDDIHPRYYGEAPLLSLQLSPDERTDFEIALLNEALPLGKPVLGICLGTQLINVALGGSLYQDIPTQIPDSLNHRAKHPVSIREGTLLHSILNVPPPATGGGKGEGDHAFSGVIPVASAHHQAVKSSGKGLIVCAVSPDGVIEAIELTDYPFCLGVQWHPERDLTDRHTKRLFKAFFMEAASGVK